MSNIFSKIANVSTRQLSLSLLGLTLILSQVANTPLYAANVGSGFGGTGFISEDPTSGFGGTGRASSGFGGTGVIGTITEFGSIWVNGIEIGYGDKTQVTSDLNENVREKATRESVLKLGQQVILETLPNNEKALTKVIHLYYPLAGKITSVTQNGLVINGQHTVQTTETTYYDENLALQVGHYVSVNGYQTATGHWQATRISHNPQNRDIYEPVPTKSFSDAVKKVVIETSRQQMKQWQTLTKLNTKKVESSARMVVEGQWQNGQIKNPQIQSYGAFVNKLMQNQPKVMQGFERAERPDTMDMKSRVMQQEQVEMMQMQRDQKSMIQDQLEQVQQIQEIKEQFNQVRALVN